MTSNPQTFGLYVHVPYCAALCHYCDFAKTANFAAEHTDRYLQQLTLHLGVWLEELARLGAPTQFTSVFFGGGTPSLFTAGYGPFFARLDGHLAAGCEVTLEANPDDVTAAHLKAWRALGVNRLSIGIQSFNDGGLRFLHRAHDSGQARRALELATAAMPGPGAGGAGVNADLIYGWAGQNEASWQCDIDTALDLGVQHLSLYNLTYETQTPLGRAVRRGALTPAGDEQLAGYYDTARLALAGRGLQHEEISNWALPGASCQHNWLYWSDRPFLGIGAGAHGYLPLPDLATSAGSGWGVRYAYPRSDRAFMKGLPTLGPAAALGPASWLQRYGVVVEEERGADAWLTEYVGSGLRTCRGLDIPAIERRLGRRFRPTAQLQHGLAQGVLTLGSDGRLYLTPAEWFRENAWAVQVLLAFAV